MADLYEVFLQLDRKKRALGVTLVLLGLLVSAVVGSLVSDFFSRARPSLELASVTFEGALGKKSKLTVTPTLRKAYDDAPISFNDFNEQITLEALTGFIASAKDYNATLPGTLIVLKEVTSILEKSPLDANKDNLRYELLRHWVEAPGNMLDPILRNIISKADRVGSLLSNPKYKAHPTTPPWNSPETATVWLDATKSYRLSDEKIFDTDDSQKRAEKFAVSLYRRLWIYLDRDLLLELLKEAEATLNELITKSSSFERALVTFEETNNPKRLEATVVVTNVGKSSVIVRTAGLLRLTSTQKNVDLRMLSSIDDVLAENAIITIPAGEGRTIKYYSVQTAKEISDQQFGGNLQAIYASEILSCSFGALRVAAGTEDKPLITSRSANFGTRVRENSLQKLSSALH